MSSRDRGLQPERTALAWTRTAMAMAVNAVLIVRLGGVYINWLLVLAGLLVGGLSLVVFVVASARRKQLDSDNPGSVSRKSMLLASLCTVLAAFCGGLAML
jgi:uncharacterized membrane protein YidH (DUF202 family)